MRLQRLMCVATMLCMGGCIFTQDEQPEVSGTNNARDMAGQEMGVTPDMSVKPDMDSGPDLPSVECDVADDCGAGEECCDGVCVDTSSDASSCGGCGLACAQGDSCAQGSCLCGASNTPTPAVVELGAFTRYEMIPYIPEDEAPSDKRQGMYLIKQTSDTLMEVRLLNERGEQLATPLMRTLEQENGLRIEGFKAVPIQGGFLLLVNWSKAMGFSRRHETASLYIVGFSSTSNVWSILPGQTESPGTSVQDIDIKAMGFAAFNEGLVTATIFTIAGSESNTILISYDKDPFTDESKPLVFDTNFGDMKVKDNSEILLSVAGDTMAGSIAATWEGSPNSNALQRNNGALILKLEDEKATQERLATNLFVQYQPAGMAKVPLSLWPVFGDVARGWFYMSTNFGDEISNIDLTTTQGGSTTIANAKMLFSTAFAYNLQPDLSQSGVVFAWLESSTRQDLLSFDPSRGQLMRRVLRQGERGASVLDGEAKVVGTRDDYTRVRGMSYTATRQLLLAERGSGQNISLDIFALEGGAPICAAGAAAP